MDARAPRVAVAATSVWTYSFLSLMSMIVVVPLVAVPKGPFLTIFLPSVPIDDMCF